MLVPNVARVTDSLNMPRVTFDAHVCEQCLFAEFYSAEPIHADGELIKQTSGEKYDVYGDWPDPDEPESTELLENHWSGDDNEITEVSRIGKRRKNHSGAKVLLTQIGNKPEEVLEILNGSLGLKIPDMKTLRKSLPLVVFKLISIDAAQGLKKLLEEAGGTVELKDRNDP